MPRPFSRGSRRPLPCLVIIDLKLGHFTHADAGQMHLYPNYAREHWTVFGENPAFDAAFLVLPFREAGAISASNAALTSDST